MHAGVRLSSFGLNVAVMGKALDRRHAAVAENVDQRLRMSIQYTGEDGSKQSSTPI
jgi:hypothetical protein